MLRGREAKERPEEEPDERGRTYVLLHVSENKPRNFLPSPESRPASTGRETLPVNSASASLRPPHGETCGAGVEMSFYIYTQPLAPFEWKNFEPGAPRRNWMRSRCGTWDTLDACQSAGSPVSISSNSRLGKYIRRSVNPGEIYAQQLFQHPQPTLFYFISLFSLLSF